MTTRPDAAAQARPKRRNTAIHAAICGLLFAAPAMAAPGDRIGGRIEVTNTSAQPSIASNSAGEFVVAWTSSSGGTVMARRFDASGVPAGDAFRVGINAADRAPSVAMNASGSFVVSWTTPRTVVLPLLTGVTTRPGQVMARRYAAGGVPLGEAFEVAPLGDESDVAIDDDGDVVVAWAENGNRGSISVFVPIGYLALRDLNVRFAGVDEIGVRRYAADGRAFPPVVVDRQIELLGRGAAGVSVAMDADGDHAVVWSRRLGRQRSDIVAQRYTASGAPSGREFVVSARPVTGNDTSSGPDAAMSPTGDLAVTWQPTLDFGPDSPARVAVFAPDNSLRVAEFAAAANEDELAALPKVAIDRVGNLRIVAGSSGGGTLFPPLQTRLYDSSGVPLTAVTPVLPSGMNTSNTVSAISVDGAGRAAIAHVFVPNDFTGGRLSVQRFQGP